MSLNDPHWGRGSRGPGGSGGGPGGATRGPPDLDELWRNFNRRLGELFGRRRRGGGDEPPRTPSSWQIGGGASLLAVLIVLVWLAGGFSIVVEGPRRAVLTLRRYSDETTRGPRVAPYSALAPARAWAGGGAARFCALRRWGRSGRRGSSSSGRGARTG